MKKMISVSLPCRNEQENIEALVAKITEQFEKHLPEYDYQIQFSDNCSTDNTRTILRKLCASDAHVRAIFNVASFSGSAFHSMLQVDGDCCIHMASDFQDPPELIPDYVHAWEAGAKIVCGIKKASQESPFLWAARSLYYKIMEMCSTITQIPQFTGFGLYDRDFVELIRRLNDPTPTLRGLVAEYGYRVERVEFIQPKRKGGKSKNDFYSLFDYAMRNFTTYTRVGMHIATLGGMAAACISFLVGIGYLIMKLLFWQRFAAGIAPLTIGVFFLGSVQVFFIGLIGEYILNMNARIINRPLVVEEERVNFPDGVRARPDRVDPFAAYGAEQ